MPILNSYSASESRSRLYILEAPTRICGFVGSWASDGSECERKPRRGLLTRMSRSPCGRSTSAGSLLRVKNAAWPVYPVFEAV